MSTAYVSDRDRVTTSSATYHVEGYDPFDGTWCRLTTNDMTEKEATVNASLAADENQSPYRVTTTDGRVIATFAGMKGGA